MTATSVDDLFALYRRWGLHGYDEELSQLDHALQVAALATTAGASDALVAASLLHDVGHLLDLERSGRTGPASQDLAHETTGSRHLTALLPAEVTGPIALHVRAKRYRCAVDNAYRDGLSAGSQASLDLQGGPMDRAEVAAFEQNPGFQAAVSLREWDDRGKVEGLVVEPLEHYRQLLESLVVKPTP